MSLNNHGWGMRDMIIFTCILILFLLLADYLINTLYDNITPPESNSQNFQTPIIEKEEKPLDNINFCDYEYYKSIEVKLRLATYNYLMDTKPDLTQNIEKITLESLVEKDYLSSQYDQFGNKQCQGYSNVYQDDSNEYTIKTYIKCSNYITEGYEGVN